MLRKKTSSRVAAQLAGMLLAATAGCGKSSEDHSVTQRDSEQAALLSAARRTFTATSEAQTIVVRRATDLSATNRAAESPQAQKDFQNSIKQVQMHLAANQLAQAQSILSALRLEPLSPDQTVQIDALREQLEKLALSKGGLSGPSAKK